MNITHRHPLAQIKQRSIIVFLFAMLTMATHRVVAYMPVTPGQVRFHDMARDTARLTQMLTEVEALKLKTPGDRIVAMGERLLGTPYVAHTLEADSVGDPERLTVNLDGIDCTTFVETVTALAMTIDEGRTGWRDFLYNLEKLRYRGGEMNGYASRLHYVCDWIVNNRSKGIITEVTDHMPGVRYAEKTIDFMTANRDRYPALTDSLTYERVKNTESGYHRHRYPYIRTNDTGARKALDIYRNGDILAFTSSLKNLDVTHMGILVIDPDGTPRVMHASSSLGKVVISDSSLADFLKRNRSLTGIRLLRLLEY